MIKIIGIIYSLTVTKGLKKLNQIADNYKLMGIEVIESHKTKTSVCYCFENGDIWRLRCHAEIYTYARGDRCNVALIDENIRDKHVYEDLLPNVTAPPFQAWNWF